MLRPGAAPFGEQVAILIFGPPIMSAIIWVLSRGWAAGIQGGGTSQQTKDRQALAFWVSLSVMYIAGVGVCIQAWFY